MSQYLAKFFWVFLAVFSVNLLAQEALTLITEDGPPHMIQVNDGGIDIDITKQVLQSLGYQTDIIYAPLKRAKVQVTMGEADLTVPTFLSQDSDSFYISKPIIDYRPMVFSAKAFNFSTITDIKDLRVRSFQGATGYFGDAFVAMTKHNQYLEIPNMETLVMMLVTERVDVIILDYYIFYFYLKNLSIDRPKKVIHEHELIPPVKAAVGFHDAKLRDKFDQAYQVFEQQGKVKKIVQHYIGDN
ncbi:substrate-binding periplasmic protein [Thalassotalea ganghwensis]